MAARFTPNVTTDTAGGGLPDEYAKHMEGVLFNGIDVGLGSVPGAVGEPTRRLVQSNMPTPPWLDSNARCWLSTHNSCGSNCNCANAVVTLPRSLNVLVSTTSTTDPPPLFAPYSSQYT